MIHDFSDLSIKGLCKAGNIILPGNKNLPRFSETEFVHHLGRMTNYMYLEDKDGLKLLTTLFAFMPNLIIRLILWVASLHEKFPRPLSAILKQINIGVRGVVFTLYYSGLDDKKDQGKKILENLNFDSKINTVITEDTEMENLLKENNPLLHQSIPKLSGNSDLDFSLIEQTAKQALEKVSKLTIKERLNYVLKIKDVIISRQEEIIDIIQKETHKCRTDILVSEIFPILEHIEFLRKYAGKGLSKEKVPTPISMMGKKSEIWFEPLGTILIISPWNYPLYQAIVPITCAFVSGNATIYKPSEITPLFGLVESILNDANWNESWVQIIYGDGKTGSNLIKLRPQKIFFTGSVATGKKIMNQASEYLIPVELELGGKDPMIVFNDVNLNRAVKGAAWGAFTTTGQSCTSVERIYVQESIYKDFKNKLVEETKNIKIAIDQDGNSDMGGMISMKQVEIVADLVQDALSKGAKLLTGNNWDFKSRFIPPMIIEGTTHDMRINQEEIFGPILPIMSFKTEEEAIKLANDSAFGLSASVWSKDLERAKRVSSQLITGNISINNVMISEGNHSLPFGGIKDSGIGRYKGIHGLRGFCNIKSVLVDSDSKKIEANWYPYTSIKYKFFSGLVKSIFYHGPKKWIGLLLNGIPLEGHAQKAKR